MSPEIFRISWFSLFWVVETWLRCYMYDSAKRLENELKWDWPLNTKILVTFLFFNGFWWFLVFWKDESSLFLIFEKVLKISSSISLQIPHQKSDFKFRIWSQIFNIFPKIHIEKKWFHLIKISNFKKVSFKGSVCQFSTETKLTHYISTHFLWLVTLTVVPDQSKMQPRELFKPKFIIRVL